MEYAVSVTLYMVYDKMYEYILINALCNIKSNPNNGIYTCTCCLYFRYIYIYNMLFINMLFNNIIHIYNMCNIITILLCYIPCCNYMTWFIMV